MDESVKSPLIRGKPAWHVRYWRIFMVYMVVNVLLLVGQFMVISRFSSNALVASLYALIMLIWVFGFQVWMSRWIRSYGLSMWRLRDMLVELGKHRGGASVPCPSCLYPLCDLPDADRVHVCSECGCGIRGSDAIRAWDRLRGYKTPEAWAEWFFDEESPGW